MLLFSTRILVFCVIILIGSLSSFLYALSERRSSSFSYSLFMTIVVLSLAESTMSVSLFRSWRDNRSCLVMFGGGGLALERILVTCGYYLLVLMGVGR